MEENEAGMGMEKDRNSSYMLNNVKKPRWESHKDAEAVRNGMQIIWEEHCMQREEQGSGPEVGKASQNSWVDSVVRVKEGRRVSHMRCPRA